MDLFSLNIAQHRIKSFPMYSIYVGWYAILGHTQSEITSVWSKIFKVYAYVEVSGLGKKRGLFADPSCASYKSP
jgi:hypothetical protein